MLSINQHSLKSSCGGPKLGVYCRTSKILDATAPGGLVFANPLPADFPVNTRLPFRPSGE